MESQAVSSWVKFFTPVFLILLFYTFAAKLGVTLLFTAVAYLVTAMGRTGLDFSNTTNEIASQYVMLSYALAAFIVSFTAAQADKALYRYTPFWNHPNKSIWHLERDTKEELVRGLSSGLIASLVFLAIFTYANQVAYLGVYITSTIGSPIFPLFFIDLLSVILLVVCEEFLFRHKILRHLNLGLGPVRANLVTSALYVFVKYVQFPLTTLDVCNLLLLNVAVGFYYLRSQRVHRGLGFIAAVFALLHSLAGLPLWSHQSPSFFLFKHTQKASEFLSGAAAGPFAGLGLLSILLFFAVSSFWQWKRSEKFTR